VLIASCVDTGLVGRTGAARDAQVCDGSDCVVSPACDAEARDCRECRDDSDCVGNPGGPYCDDNRNECEECRRDSDCANPGDYCSNGRCRECEDDGDCERDESCDEGRCESNGNR